MLRNEPLVIVVDDDPAICQSLSRMLVTNGYRVRAFQSAKAYLDERTHLEPDCLVADIRMPHIDGVALHRMARRAGLEVPTIFITASSDVPTIISAMKAGAVDLLTKPFSADALLAGIDAAVKLGRSCRDERAHILELWARAATLTQREAEVAALVALGRLNKQVAALIGTREKTVKVHRARAMHKLEVTSVAQLVRTLDELIAARRERIVRADTAHTAPKSVAVMVRALARVSAPRAQPAPANADARTTPGTTNGQYPSPPATL
jgi:FixJ family two-component response regulator